jgi:hypothetical protein
VKALRRALLLVLPLGLGGCSVFSGLTQSLGSVLSTAIALAIIAIPFVLSYYLYKGKL